MSQHGRDAADAGTAADQAGAADQAAQDATTTAAHDLDTFGAMLLDEFTGGFAAVDPAVSAIRLFAALLLGAIVGFERERRGKAAGLRTHMLVAIAACLFIILGREIAQLEFRSDEVMRVDPLRLIEAVTQGVAFLAAGLIFIAGDKVKNITTGASLWLAGAIGLGCGAGEIPLAAMATLLTVTVLAAIKWLEVRVLHKPDADDD